MRYMPNTRVMPSSGMPPRNFKVCVPAPRIASIISFSYPCRRSLSAPSSPEFVAAMLRKVAATMPAASAGETRSHSSRPRLKYSLGGLPSAPRGKPASTQALKPFRTSGWRTRRSP